MADYATAFTHTLHRDHKEAIRLASQLHDEATIADEVIRWNSNGSVPPEDIVALAAFLGFPIDVAKCKAARTADLTAFLTAYRANPPQPDLNEMRAAFGPGRTVVDVITGKKHRT